MQPPPSDRILSISQLNRGIKSVLEDSYPAIWVRGEISNFRQPGSGHNYFSLKEANSQISAVMFRGDAARSSLQIRSGMQVIAYGSLSVYEPQGTYQLIIRHIMPDGQGQLQLEFERLKQKLNAEGLFAPDRKVLIPKLPKRISIITSPTGAAIQDFLRILHRRNWKGNITIFPSKVQGTDAPKELLEALNLAVESGRPDLIILTRGGGSMEDLWAFNDEALVRRISEIKIPVISAVGHEIDFVLTDFVADKRAETPSAAAEIISSHYVEYREQVQDLTRNFKNLIRQEILDRKNKTHSLSLELKNLSPKNRIEQLNLRTDHLESRLLNGFQSALTISKEKAQKLSEKLEKLEPTSHIKLKQLELLQFRKQIDRILTTQLEKRESQIDHLQTRLGNSSLQKTLSRGYSVTTDSSGKILNKATNIKKGESITTRLSDGEFISIVENITIQKP